MDLFALAKRLIQQPKSRTYYSQGNNSSSCAKSSLQISIIMHYKFIIERKIKNIPMPQESMAHGGDFLITAQSDFASSIAWYCVATSHAYR